MHNNVLSYDFHTGTQHYGLTILYTEVGAWFLCLIKLVLFFSLKIKKRSKKFTENQKYIIFFTEHQNIFFFSKLQKAFNPFDINWSGSLLIV